MIKFIDGKNFYLYELSGEFTCPHCGLTDYFEYHNDEAYKCECGKKFSVTFQIHEELLDKGKIS